MANENEKNTNKALSELENLFLLDLIPESADEANKILREAGIDTTNLKVEGREIFRQLNLVAQKFLSISMDYFGCILQDENLVRCVKQQRIISQAYPDSVAAYGFRNLARRTKALPAVKVSQGAPHLFWGHIFQDGAISSKF